MSYPGDDSVPLVSLCPRQLLLREGGAAQGSSARHHWPALIHGDRRAEIVIAGNWPAAAAIAAIAARGVAAAVAPPMQAREDVGPVAAATLRQRRSQKDEAQPEGFFLHENHSLLRATAATATLPVVADSGWCDPSRQAGVAFSRGTVRGPDLCRSILREKYAPGMTRCNRSREFGGNCGQKNGPAVATAKDRQISEAGFSFLDECKEMEEARPKIERAPDFLKDTATGSTARSSRRRARTWPAARLRPAAGSKATAGSCCGPASSPWRARWPAAGRESTHGCAFEPPLIPPARAGFRTRRRLHWPRTVPGRPIVPFSLDSKRKWTDVGLTIPGYVDVREDTTDFNSIRALQSFPITACRNRRKSS